MARADHEEKISEAFYRNSINLDQENAHFVVVDMVLEVLEAAKWSLSQKHSDSFSSTDSGYVGAVMLLPRSNSYVQAVGQKLSHRRMHDFSVAWYMKRLRYCDYLGKYFCDGCHGGWQAIIPARVLSNWDFGRYPVCQFSKQILESIWEKPLFKITDVAKKLYSQAKELQKFRELQEQLISIKKLLKACRLSKGVLDEFQQLPSHLSDELHLFAMDDLIKIKRCQLLAKAKAIMKSAVDHVEACQLCLANGFICEFCHGKDVLFPFQRDICTRCQVSVRI
ncbi:protein RUBCNL-like [Silurus meridionalis]|nr:protein RUBCNL-like [Silurus meridionalis]